MTSLDKLLLFNLFIWIVCLLWDNKHYKSSQQAPAVIYSSVLTALCGLAYLWHITTFH